jgi:hypothetical protein
MPAAKGSARTPLGPIQSISSAGFHETTTTISFLLLNPFQFHPLCTIAHQTDLQNGAILGTGIQRICVYHLVLNF